MQMNERPSPDIDDLVRCYYSAVVRLAQSILVDGSSLDDAEDAAQETFIAAARSLETYRGQASPKTWLFSIAINTCRSRLRRRKVQRRLVQALALAQQLFGQRDIPEQCAEQSERDRQLWDAVDGLNEKHRMIIVLRYVHELSSAEIGQVLGITEGTVHSRLHYARQQLAGQLRRSPVFEGAEVV